MKESEYLKKLQEAEFCKGCPRYDKCEIIRFEGRHILGEYGSSEDKLTCVSRYFKDDKIGPITSNKLERK